MLAIEKIKKIYRNDKTHIFTHGSRHEVRKSMMWLVEWPLGWVTRRFYNVDSLRRHLSAFCPSRTWLTLIDLLFERQNLWKQVINSLVLWAELGKELLLLIAKGDSRRINGKIQILLKNSVKNFPQTLNWSNYLKLYFQMLIKFRENKTAERIQTSEIR